MTQKALHPDLHPFTCKGGLFDVSNPVMESHIGRLVRFVQVDCAYREQTFVIGGIQRIWDNSMAYRVYPSGEEDDFGCPARPSELVFLPTTTSNSGA